MDERVLKAVMSRDSAVHKHPVNEYQHFVNLHVFLAGTKTSSTVEAAQEEWLGKSSAEQRKFLTDLTQQAKHANAIIVVNQLFPDCHVWCTLLREGGGLRKATLCTLAVNGDNYG